MILILLFVVMGMILYFAYAAKGKSSLINRMMEQNMDTLNDMTTGEMGEKIKDMSKTVIDVRKNILEENKDTLSEMAKMEAEIKKDAVKVKAEAVKEGFGRKSTMYCKNCGAVIDSDSRFCKNCGKAQK